MSTRYDHPDWLASIRFNPLLSETYKKKLAFVAIMILMLTSSRVS